MEVTDRNQVIEMKTISVEEQSADLTVLIEEAKGVDPQKLDEEDLEADFSKHEKEFLNLNGIFIKIAESTSDWCPSASELKTMKLHLESMMITREKAKVRSKYEGKTYCGKDTKWCAQKLGTFMDFLVSGATTCVLLQETIVSVWNQFKGKIDDLIHPEDSIDAFYNTTTVSAFETTPSVVQASSSYYVIGMIAGSIAASKLRDHLHAKAIAFEKRMGLLQDLESRAEILLKEASARYKFWEKCSQLHCQKERVSSKQYRAFRRLQCRMKEFGGTADPMYRHGRNLIIQKNSRARGRLLNITAAIVDREVKPKEATLEEDRKGALCCSSKKNTSEVKTLKDLLAMEKELTSIREGVALVTEKANQLTDNEDAHAADYYVIIEQLKGYFGDLERIFEEVNAMPNINFKEAKKETCGEVVVQTVFELASLVTISLSEIESEIGETSKIMQYVGMGAFSAGFVFSRLRDHFSTVHIHQLQSVKYQRRLIALEPVLKDLHSLIDMFSAHQSYRGAKDDSSREKEFRKVLNITKDLPDNILGAKLDHMKKNLALTTDAAVLCVADTSNSRRAAERKRFLNAIRRAVKRGVLKNKAGAKEQLKYEQYLKALQILQTSPDSSPSSLLSEEAKTYPVRRMPSASDIDSLLDRGCLESKSSDVSSSPSSESKSEEGSPLKVSPISPLKILKREKLKRQIEQLQSENRLANWLPEIKEYEDSSGGSGSDTADSGFEELTDVEEED